MAGVSAPVVRDVLEVRSTVELVPFLITWLTCFAFVPSMRAVNGREHMMASLHPRHQIHDIEIAARRDGTMLAVRDRIWVDLGAYNSWGIVLPYNTVAHLLGPHRVPSLSVECRGVVTNKTPNAPYRGAGRPEAVFAMDRIV